VFQKTARLGMRGKHLLNALAKIRVIPTHLIEIGRTLLRRALLQGGKEDRLKW
jgi:hypothetical protein